MLVWYGTNCILCVNGQETAGEPLSEVSAPPGKLIIGGSFGPHAGASPAE
jgi:hypothetical protein